uniref:Uncharacterized protein n=1 Tax=Chromera velia CCMP2878 TaxID=1169474 RepID=A0A0G4GHA9_9ALVE|eukprot:Cvel_21850.t1-p1 / transcript=Cvel_21850.t1 / gene=Cvel_21850 / organism=Chromera_velia_CCMP2878 / gene_product=hypothetical protein / transcript_product=hypothetical protein / location=Cvel_scaffold2088:177-1956(+) / protein_length=151 / sequence_SO=supercontig / SO=protein_coding / is_pseudo=false
MRDRSAANRLKERKAAATTGPMTRMKRPANGTGGPLWGGSLLERLDLARRASDTRVSLVWQQGGGGSLNDSDQQGETPRERTPAGDAAVSAPYPPLGRSATMEERPSKGQMHLLQSPQLGFPGGGALGEREREETVDLEGQLRAPLLDKSE